MTRKDYQLIANAIKRERETYADNAGVQLRAIDNLVYGIGKALAEDNERFDFERFAKACGITKEEKAY